MTGFPSTAELLVSGDDPRLTLDPISGANHYLCPPYPDTNLLRFGSSTASTIDRQGWAIANQFRDQIAHESTTIGVDACCKWHRENICNTLRTLCELNDNTAIALTESGTSAHRLAAQTAQANTTSSLHAIVMQPSETGSGVPNALALDNSVPIHTIALRADDSTPLSTAIVDNAVIQQAEQILKQDASLLLVLVDGSKSGLTAPSLTTALDLRHRFPHRVQLLLDGCQFRFNSATLRHYLDHGLMVVITGSKFLAGPSFSAALLLPDSNHATTSDTAEPGLLLRWQVALANLQALQQQDCQQVYHFLSMFAQHLQQRLHNDAIFASLATPTLPHATIFPFLLHDQHGPLTMAQSLTLYQQLQQQSNPKVQLGRPFHAGIRADGEPIGALRLNLSAPLIIDAIANKHQHAVINQAMLALDQVQACVRAQGITH